MIRPSIHPSIPSLLCCAALRSPPKAGGCTRWWEIGLESESFNRRFQMHACAHAGFHDIRPPHNHRHQSKVGESTSDRPCVPCKRGARSPRGRTFEKKKQTQHSGARAGEQSLAWSPSKGHVSLSLCVCGDGWVGGEDLGPKPIRPSIQQCLRVRVLTYVLASLAINHTHAMPRYP